MSDLVIDFLERAVQQPSAVAVIVGDEVAASYAELADKVHQVAAALSGLGPGPDGEYGPGVGIVTDSPVDLLAGMLGARLAGWWYLPMDPAQPAARIDHFIVTARCQAIIASEPRVRGGKPAVPVLSVSELPVADPAAGPADVTRAGAGLQYILFTSGSTGSPKGAGVRSDAFERLVTWYRELLQVSSEDRVLIVSSPGFDLTQKNCWVPLTVGAAMVFPGRLGQFDPRRIHAVTQRWHPTLLNCAPSAFFAIAEWPSVWRSGLRTLVLGGERIDRARLASWAAASDFSGSVINGYGPTECSAVVAAATLPTDVLQPVCGSELYVVGPDWREVEPGVAGELWIGGSPVGTGYVSNPVQTAHRFVACLRHPGELAFRSGDLAVAGTDGSVQILRRIDPTDIKVSGVRIDLNEVSDALLETGLAREAVAFVGIDRRGETRLAAVISPEVADVIAVRRALITRVPTSYVPVLASVVAFPRTLSGKSDQRAAVQVAAEMLGLELIEQPPAEPERSFLVLRSGSAYSIWPESSPLPPAWELAWGPLQLDQAAGIVARSSASADRGCAPSVPNCRGTRTQVGSVAAS